MIKFQKGDVVKIMPDATYGQYKSLVYSLLSWITPKHNFTVFNGKPDLDGDIYLRGTGDHSEWHCYAKAEYVVLVERAGESVSTEPDVLGNSNCPICGSSGFDMAFAFECSNGSCQNSR